MNVGVMSVELGTVAAWVAAAISATATGVTLWIRRRDRPEAEFLLEQAQILWGHQGRHDVLKSFGAPRPPDEVLSLINVRRRRRVQGLCLEHRLPRPPVPTGSRRQARLPQPDHIAENRCQRLHHAAGVERRWSINGGYDVHGDDRTP